MTDPLEQLRALRALRERRAEAAAATARARATLAEAAEARAKASLRAHDATEAARDAAAHDALLAKGFTQADLLDAQTRAHHATQGREGLAQGLSEAAAAFSHAQADQREAEGSLHRATRRHAALHGLSDQLDAVARRRAEAVTESEAEE